MLTQLYCRLGLAMLYADNHLPLFRETPFQTYHGTRKNCRFSCKLLTATRFFMFVLISLVQIFAFLIHYIVAIGFVVQIVSFRVIFRCSRTTIGPFIVPFKAIFNRYRTVCNNFVSCFMID